MQTFMPFDVLEMSVDCLDRRRCANQANEATIIANTLLGKYEGGWPHHPATKMWRGYEYALLEYAFLCAERAVREGWVPRDYAAVPKIRRLLEALVALPETNLGLPPWMGDEDFHLSHRSNLLAKDPEHYRTFWPDMPDTIPYLWPRLASDGLDYVLTTTDGRGREVLDGYRRRKRSWLSRLLSVGRS